MPAGCSPFKPAKFPTLPRMMGLEIGVCSCGLRYQERDDLLSIRLLTEQPTIAAVFTQNAVVGAPVKWSRECLPHSPSRLVVAAGNANVFTGKAGWQALQEVAEQIAPTSIPSVYFAMTGVIGEPFSAEPLLIGLQNMSHARPDAAQWHRAAQAIMTTDTYAKGSSAGAVIEKTPVHIAGIAKGSGMIAPDLATMLVFLFTDATIPQPVLQAMLNEAMEESFNSISVDGDTSTSDMVTLIATGSLETPTTDNHLAPLYADFRRALQLVCNDLSAQVIRDGEGITKLLCVTVSEARNRDDAKRVAMSIANSPLVKTAISGEDANWGRIAMAIGKSGVPINAETLAINIGGHRLAAHGAAIAFDVQAVDHLMRKREIPLSVSLGMGDAKATVFGNDLSHDYIRINADYRS